MSDGATVIAEAGADLRAFPTEKQFTSWLDCAALRAYVEAGSLQQHRHFCLSGTDCKEIGTRRLASS
jgi:hypothetical protein